MKTKEERREAAAEARKHFHENELRRQEVIREQEKRHVIITGLKIPFIQIVNTTGKIAIVLAGYYLLLRLILAVT
jgi:hypothetical protein